MVGGAIVIMRLTSLNNSCSETRQHVPHKKSIRFFFFFFQDSKMDLNVYDAIFFNMSIIDEMYIVWGDFKW